jgi:hypothetical protein
MNAGDEARVIFVAQTKLVEQNTNSTPVNTLQVQHQLCTEKAKFIVAAYFL